MKSHQLNLFLAGFSYFEPLCVAQRARRHSIDAPSQSNGLTLADDVISFSVVHQDVDGGEGKL